LGTIRGKKTLPVKKVVTRTNAPLPTNFDARTQWPDCPTIGEVRDQSTCGSCWAFGAVESISDRYCIQKKEVVRISAQDMLTCCDECGMGCDGGYPSAAWQFWVDQGLVTGGLYGDDKTCRPYSLKPCDHHTTGKYGPCGESVPTPDCEQSCSNGYPKSYDEDKHYGSEAYSVQGVEEIQKEIQTNGPVEADFDVYDDFLNYKTGVYQRTSDNFLGGHAIRILGWGEEDGTPYWLIANSWNEGWGDHGFFKIIRGQDECGIEDDINAGTPK
jgi:cathepsin B